MNPFTFNTSKSIQFGVGALGRIGDLVRAQIGERVMLVTDPGMMSTGIVDRALQILAAAGVSVELFKDVEADPPEAVILKAVEQAKAADIAGVVWRRTIRCLWQPDWYHHAHNTREAVAEFRNQRR